MILGVIPFLGSRWAYVYYIFLWYDVGIDASARAPAARQKWEIFGRHVAHHGHYQMMICSNYWTPKWFVPDSANNLSPKRLIDLADDAVPLPSPTPGDQETRICCPHPVKILAWQKFWQVWSPMQEKIDRCWFNEKSCQRKGGDRSLASRGQVEEDKCLVLVQRGKRLKFAAPTQPHEPLLPSDPTISRFSMHPIILVLAIGIFLSDLLPATVKLVPRPFHPQNFPRLLFSRFLWLLAQWSSIFNPLTSHNCCLAVLPIYFGTSLWPNSLHQDTRHRGGNWQAMPGQVSFVNSSEQLPHHHTLMPHA